MGTESLFFEVLRELAAFSEFYEMPELKELTSSASDTLNQDLANSIGNVERPQFAEENCISET